MGGTRRGRSGGAQRAACWERAAAPCGTSGPTTGAGDDRDGLLGGRKDWNGGAVLHPLRPDAFLGAQRRPYDVVPSDVRFDSPSRTRRRTLALSSSHAASRKYAREAVLTAVVDTLHAIKEHADACSDAVLGLPPSRD